MPDGLVLLKDRREAGDQVAQAELLHGQGELALEQGDDVVDGRELIEIRQGEVIACTLTGKIGFRKAATSSWMGSSGAAPCVCATT